MKISVNKQQLALYLTGREGRGENLLASQTKVKNPPILKPTLLYFDGSEG